MAVTTLGDFKTLKNPTVEHLKTAVTSFLSSLTGPTIIDIDGADQSRTRVISTLIHGNEPSGFFAVHKWLLEGHTPATNVRFIISSVLAAKATPTFSHRHIEDEEDLNRCFSSEGSSVVYDRARAMKTIIEDVSPECVIDLHNTSGSGPGFAVTTKNDAAHKYLAAFFVKRMIMTGIRLGALMEVDFGCPIITIECGGAKDSSSDDIAYEGIRDILSARDLDSENQTDAVEVLDHPMRVEISPNISLAYGTVKDANCVVTMRADIESCNTGVTIKGTKLGWVADRDLTAFSVVDETGRDVTSTILGIEGESIITQQDLRIFMATTRADIAHEDCLFYVVPVTA